MAKSLIPAILARVVRRLPMVLLTLLPAWLLHTYLIVVKNEGYSGFGHWTAPYIHVQGNGVTSFMTFGLGAGLIWSILLSLWRPGLQATLKTLTTAPTRWLQSLTDSSPGYRAGLALGLALSLLGGRSLGLPPQVGLFLSVSTLILGMGFPGTVLRIFLEEASVPLLQRYPRLAAFPATNLLRALFTAIPLGLALHWFFTPWTTEKIGWLALAYVVYSFYQKKEPAPTSWVLWLGWLSLAECLRPHGAWADDGGWVEATGNGDLTWANIVQWWNSTGSGQAITSGVAPVTGAAVGATMVPPLAPPQDGLDYKEDVSQNVTKGDEEYRYGLGIARQGTSQLPADGKTQAFGYSVGESNDPKVKPGDIARAAQFTTTAATGFELRIVKVESALGGDHKQFTIIAVAAPDSAFAPGEVPSAVYAEASSPAGLVRGHMAYTILVGTGKLHIEPLPRTWLRADGSDHFSLVAYIEPTQGAQITDQERKETLELACYGPNAEWVGVSAPGEGEFYRYWTLQAAQPSQPGSFKQPLEVELGLQGRFAGGLLQEKLTLRVLPPPTLEAEQPIPFMVPEFQEVIEVAVHVVGVAEGDQWELDSPELVGGPDQTVLWQESRPDRPGRFWLNFRLCRWSEKDTFVETRWKLVAREKSGSVTEPLVLRLLAASPGLHVLSPTPIQILANAKKTSKLLVTVLRWNAEKKVVEVDEKSLSAVQFKVVQEGEHSKALEAAEPQGEAKPCAGQGLSRHGVYELKTKVPVPGMGVCLGNLEAFLEGESDEHFRCQVPVALALDADSMIQQNKDQEWALLLDVLERYFHQPYLKADSSDQSGNLAPLIQIYNRWMEELQRDKPLLGSTDLREKRRCILKEAVLTWRAIGAGYMGDSKFYENLLRAAVTVDWFMDNAFSICAKAALAWMGPLGATIGSTVINKVRAYLSKLVGNSLNGIPVETTWADIQDDMWGALRDFTWQDAPELLAKKVFGTPGEGGETEVPVKVKVALLSGFIAYRFYRNYVDEDPVTKEKPVGFWRAAFLTGQDLAMKFGGDAFENYVKELPLFRGGPKVKDFRPTTPSAPPSGGTAPSGGDAPSAPSGGDAPTAPTGGDAPTAPSGGDAPAGPAGGDAPAAPAGGDAPTAPSAGNAPAGPAGGDAPTAPSGGDAPTAPAGGDAPAAPSAGDAPAGGDAPTAPSGGDAPTAPTGGDAPAGHAGGDAPAAPAGGDAPAAPAGGDAPTASSGGDAPTPTPVTPSPTPHLDSHGIPKIDLS